MLGKHAEDIMIPLDQYPHIPYWFTLRQAVAEMERSTIEVDGRKSLPRALLVFDEKYHLLGIVRRRDLMRGLEPKFLRTMPISSRKEIVAIEGNLDLVEFSAGRISRAVKEQSENPVSEVMTSIKSTVGHDDHLAKVIGKIINKDLTLLPVLKDDKVIGVIRSVDVFRQVAALLK